jgi:hypothetical protein
VSADITTVTVYVRSRTGDVTFTEEQDTRLSAIDERDGVEMLTKATAAAHSWIVDRERP